MKLTECFKIRLYTNDTLSFSNLDFSKVVFDLDFSRKTIEYNPIHIQADPFLFVNKDTLYLFYESKKRWENGKISMVSTKDLIEWTDPKIVLEESFHLSFPYVFEDNGKVYMIPETSEKESVRLYEASDNLTSFRYKKDLLSFTNLKEQIATDFCDSSIFKIENRYYLQTTVFQNGKCTLLLFLSDALEGTYIQHPLSPIVNSNKYGRNGGSVIVYNGDMYRIAQDCEKRYGDNIHIFKIDNITSEEYHEHLIISNLFDPSLPFYSEGGHHISTTNFHGKTIIATDAKEYHKLFFPTLVRRFVLFVKMFFEKIKPYAY